MAYYDYQLLLKRLLEQGVAWAPGQEIIYRDRMRYSYADMYARVLRLGAALARLGAEQGTRVGVIEWDSHRYLEMYFGIPGIGAVLHTINPRLSQEDMVYTVEHAEDEILVFHEDFLPQAEDLRSRVPSIRKFVLITDGEQTGPDWLAGEYEALLTEASPLDELPDLDEDTQATLSYTTGTTGRPKGVYFSHRQLVLHTWGWSSAALLGNFGGMDKYDVYMPLTPMFHVHAWGVPYWATTYGLKQVYPGKYEPGLIVKLVVEEQVTFSHCVPTILQMIINAPEAREADLSNWHIITGGARLTKGLTLAAKEMGIKLTGGYGLSESCPFIVLSCLKPSMEQEWDDERQLDWSIKTGFPMPLVKLRVVGADGRDVACDGAETGEIVLRAPWLTPGYYREDEGSQELWEGDWMHTGDVANVDEYGYVQIVDRIKDVIKSGGEWIVSMELENLLSLHEDVLEAAVIGVPDPRWDERPLAIIVPVEGAEERISAETLREHLRAYVDSGDIAKWAVPELYTFVAELPRTSVGKIDKRELRRQFPAAPGRSE
jgi:fatty-acyl-CoA synthase